MSAEWALSISVKIFKRKGEICSCSCYRAVKYLQHGMKVVNRVIEKRLCRKVTVIEMQFDSMSERGTIDAGYILRRLQEVYHAKIKKLIYVFCGHRESY